MNKTAANSVILLSPKTLITRAAIGLLLLAGLIVICSCLGPEQISFRQVLQGPAQLPQHNPHYEIFFGVRLPRVFLAALIGAALACSGAVLQAILRNPLADPYILGISSGAGLGVIIAVLSGATWRFVGGSALAGFAFIGAMGTVWLVWFVGRLAGRTQVTGLLLAGVVVNAFLSAVIMFLISIARSEQLRATTLWLMGNISEKGALQVVLSAIIIFAGIAVIFAVSNKLNIISFGRQHAASLGVSTTKLRLIAFAFAALITAVAVSLSGLIGFVGLIIPHGVRLVFGPDHRQLLPLSAIAGAGFLVLADTAARTIVSTSELPVGVITAMTGGPFFLILLVRYNKKLGWLR